MRKILTLCLSLVVGMSSVYAGSPQPKPQRALLPSLNKAATRPAPVSLSSAQSLGGTAQNGTANVFTPTSTAFLGSFSSQKKKMVAPMKIGASGSTIYGHVEYDPSGIAGGLGLGEVFMDGTLKHVEPVALTNELKKMNPIRLRYVRDNVYYVTGNDFYDGWCTRTGDLTTGAIDLIKHSTITNWQFAAYDPAEDVVRGYVYDGVNVYFGYAPGDAPNDFTATGIFDNNTLPLQGWNVIATTYNAADKRFLLFFGPSSNNDIYEADLTNGNLTKVGSLEIPCKYTTGACYSPYDNGYVFALCSDDVCGLQILDKNTFEVKSQTDYPDLFEYGMLQCIDERKIESSAPEAATFVSDSFPEGALTGTITFKMASVSHSGTPILGNVNWVVMVDGVEVKRGIAAAGSEVTVDVSVSDNGYHIFKIRQATGTNYGLDTRVKLFIGNDTPVAPESVTLTEKTITWTPVDKGIHDGYVNPAEVTYNVYLNDELLAKEVKDASWPTNLGNDVQLNMFTASVEAVFDGRVSEKTYSNDIAYGEPVSIPYYVLPTEKEATLFTLVNPDGNDNIYFYGGPYRNYGDFSGFQYYAGYAENNGAYIYLPPMKFDDASKVYEFTGEIFRGNKNYEESYEVVLASAPNPDATIKTILSERSAFLLPEGGCDPELFTQTADFTVPSAGVYYIAIHCTSHKGERVLMTNFNVDVAKNLTPESPSSVNNLAATAGANGALNAIVTFNVPTDNAKGTQYGANDVLTIKLQAAGCETVTVTGKPGEAKSVTVPTHQGENVISAVAYKGDNNGIPSDVLVYTGVYVPSIPTNLVGQMSDDNYTVYLTWQPPTASATPGGYVAPTGVTYYFCQKIGNDWYVTDLIGTDVFSYEVELPEGTPQQVGFYGVIAENAAGMAEQLAVCNVIEGKPLEMPFTNNYYMGEEVQPIVNYSDMSFFFDGDPANFYPSFATEDNLSAIFTYAFADQTDAKFTIPKFSTKGAQHAAIELYTYGGSAGSIKICASTAGMSEPEVIATYLDTDFATPGPVKLRVELPAKFQNKGWVEPTILYSVKAMAQSMILYGFRYIDNLETDFGVTRISGTKTAAIGEEAKFVASVINYGYKDSNFPGASWTLTDSEGEVLAEVAVPAGTEPVASDDSMESEISFTPTADNFGKLYLTYTINSGDDKATNDTQTVEINVVPGDTPVVTDLTASEISHDHVTLAWSEPMGSSEVETFEEEDPFILDSVTDKIGNFTRVDGDGEIVYTFNNQNFLDLEFAGKPSSFVVYSQKQMEEVMGESSLEAHSGDHFIVAFCPGTGESPEPAANDWLISPQVVGGSAVSFYAKALTYQYGAETLEVRYSTSGTRTRDFKLLETVVLEGGIRENPVYEQYTFQLPADAKYFAIRYVSQDIFGVMIDDISYVPAESVTPVSAYEVYRNGMLAATTPDSTPGFTDNTVDENTNYLYTVLPKLADGSKGIESNKLNILTTGVNGVISGKVVYSANGVIVVKGYDNEAVSIVSADGVVRLSTPNASGNISYDAAPGIYVVKAGKDTFKLTVR